MPVIKSEHADASEERFKWINYCRSGLLLLPLLLQQSLSATADVAVLKLHLPETNRT
jgi:hypothetical protein